MFSGDIRACFLRTAVLIWAAASATTFCANLKIPYSTPVKLVLIEKLSSATNKVEDPVHLEVTEDVAVHGVVIVQRGAAAGGHVVEVARRGKLGRTGRLSIQLDWVEAVDGLSKGIRADAPPTRRSRKSVFVPPPIRFIAPGKDAVLPEGTRFTAYMIGNDEIAMPEGARVSAAAPARAAADPMAELSVVKFSSIPEGAEINVDGKFVGTTPSSIRLAPGDHKVAIEQTGFKPWQRDMAVLVGGEVSISVTLEKDP